MTYSEPNPRPRAELEVDLAASDPHIVAVALVDAAHFAEGEWLQPQAVAFIRDGRPAVARAALVALSILARRRALNYGPGLDAALSFARSERALVGYVDDVMDDIRMYGLNTEEPP